MPHAKSCSPSKKSLNGFTPLPRVKFSKATKKHDFERNIHLESDCFLVLWRVVCPCFHTKGLHLEVHSLLWSSGASWKYRLAFEFLASLNGRCRGPDNTSLAVRPTTFWFDGRNPPVSMAFLPSFKWKDTYLGIGFLSSFLLWNYSPSLPFS